MKTNWNRFTMVDGGILIAALGLGVWLATAEVSGRTDHPFQGAETLVIWAVLSVLWAGIFAGPLILVEQLLRGRRSAPSPGEWFWLVPVPLYISFLLFLYGSQNTYLTILYSGNLGLFITLVYVVIQCLFTLAAFVRFVSSVYGKRRDVACRWTDLLGCSVCIYVGPVMAFAVISSLRNIP
jgi:hypothetical protein